MNFNIGFHIGVTGSIGDAFSSGEGLEDALFMHPSMLFQADEFDCIFNTMKYSKDARGESINEKLLKFYGTANTIYPMRKKAIAKKNDGSARSNHTHKNSRSPIIIFAARTQNEPFPNVRLSKFQQEILRNLSENRCRRYFQIFPL